ncbi:hypothetical protein HW561_20765 [Rhodobacteraceae bacterium B1Z28]|uniref:Uncharacterized protein n=1 Tax=Ruegeria haliotis TaxID=2747601 RepID=A0ABX2PVL2_9RHOB|nr:hypothetical protein [Ruegeria haliotis]NVO58225.1 hypothetical protein [Ruegeria haliotis]
MNAANVVNLGQFRKSYFPYKAAVSADKWCTRSEGSLDGDWVEKLRFFPQIERICDHTDRVVGFGEGVGQTQSMALVGDLIFPEAQAQPTLADPANSSEKHDFAFWRF